MSRRVAVVAALALTLVACAGGGDAPPATDSRTPAAADDGATDDAPASGTGAPGEGDAVTDEGSDDATGDDDALGSDRVAGDDATDDDDAMGDRAAATVVAPSAALEVGDSMFLPTSCPFEVEIDLEVDCGVVEVPESRTGESDDTIELAIAILRTPAPDPAPDPVVYLAGGPGGVALAEHFVWLSGADDWQQHPIFGRRDMILVDQRGTGYSRPSLWCAPEEDVEDCHDRLVDDGVTLSAYSTPENAADIAAIRQALDIDRWNLYGGSYGTRLALVVARDHPEGVRSLLLEGIYPPDVVPAYHEYVEHSLGVLDEVRRACADQPACDSAYGDVQTLLSDALDAVDGDPGSPVDAIEFFDVVFGTLYSMPGVLDTPYALQLAASGDVEGALDVLEGGGVDPDLGWRPRDAHGRRWAADPAEDSAGLFHSIECREEMAFTDLATVEAQAQLHRAAGVDERVLDALVEAVAYPLEVVCPTWHSGTALPGERAPAASDIPALLLSGRFDPITPPVWGDRALEHLPNGTHVVFPNLAHSSVLEDPCVDRIAAAFLDDPSGPVDSGCVDDLEVPPFTLP